MSELKETSIFYMSSILTDPQIQSIIKKHTGQRIARFRCNITNQHDIKFRLYNDNRETVPDYDILISRGDNGARISVIGNDFISEEYQGANFIILLIQSIYCCIAASHANPHRTKAFQKWVKDVNIVARDSLNICNYRSNPAIIRQQAKAYVTQYKIFIKEKPSCAKQNLFIDAVKNYIDVFRHYSRNHHLNHQLCQTYQKLNQLLTETKYILDLANRGYDFVTS